MTYLASLQTTLARNVAAHLEDRWRWHKHNCPECPKNKCQHGRDLWRDLTEARTCLAEQRRLDKMPLPGQEALWGDDPSEW